MDFRKIENSLLPSILKTPISAFYSIWIQIMFFFQWNVQKLVFTEFGCFCVCSAHVRVHSLHDVISFIKWWKKWAKPYEWNEKGNRLVDSRYVMASQTCAKKTLFPSKFWILLGKNENLFLLNQISQKTYHCKVLFISSPDY